MNPSHRAATFRDGRIRVDPRARAVVIAGRPAKLSGRAFDLLQALIERRDRLVPKQELLDVVWPGLIVEENNLQVHVMNLRKLLGPDSIVTVSGRGYQFSLAEDEPAPLSERQPRAKETPIPPATLIGREELIASTCDLLRHDDARLVTLTGAGGCGKTRIGLRVAAELAHDFADGSYIVMLAPVRDPARVAAAIAAVLNVQDSGKQSIEEALVDHLRDRSILLALDNFEHVLAAAPLATRLLDGCPQLKLLVTSRALLHVRHEREVHVPPLAVPYARAAPSQVLDSPAVRLFVERARATGHFVGEEPAALAAAADICRRLDGLPLAIELAAARLRVLTPVALAERLGSRLKLLKTAASDVPQRQRTLRDAIAWSYDLLDGDEQRLFRRLAVFVGGWTLDAAEAIAGSGGVDRDVLDTLSSLIDHNLAQRVDDAGDEARFAMLETVREFATELFEASGETDALLERYAQYFTAFAETVDARLRSGGRGAWLARMNADYNNARAALSWLVIEKQDAVGALRLAGALPWYWYFSAQFGEGRGWLKLALALPGADEPSEARASALTGAARLAFYAGALEEAIALATQSVALFRSIGDRRGLGFALFHLALPTVVGNECTTAFASFDEAARCFRDADDEWGTALVATYHGSALALRPGSETEARALLTEARARFKALGDDWVLSPAAHYLGSIALREGDYEAARKLTEEMLAQARELGDTYRISRTQQQLAEIALAKGGTDEALRLLQASIALTHEQRRTGDLALQLRLLARIEAARSRPARAVRFYAAASRLERQGTTMPPDDPAVHQRLRETLRTTLGDRGYDSEWAQGASMSAAQAVEIALSDA